MHLAKVIGTVWATQKVATLEGAKLQIIRPLTADEKPASSPIVAVDTIGAGPGETVYYVTAREAVIPYRKEMTPIDASIVGIVDHVDVYERKK
ncbi:MAG: EutN/CcmL family microcompartment protein [bacterium]